MNERGRAPILLVVVAATLGLGLAASMYLNLYQNQASEQSKRELNGQITDLRYQVKQDQAAQEAKTGTKATPTPSNAPPPTSDQGSVAGSQSVAIDQLGVHLTATAPITDLTYSYQPVNNLGVANLTTTSLMAKYPACQPGKALGLLVKRPLTSKPTSSSSVFLKAIGTFNYYYIPPTGNCATDADGRTAVTAAKSALINSVLPTLQ